jgi:hypothetical protein
MGMSCYYWTVFLGELTFLLLVLAVVIFNPCEYLKNCIYFYRVSHKSCWSCAEKADDVRSNKLKERITEYFEREPTLEQGQVTMLFFASESRDSSLSILDTNVSLIRSLNADVLQSSICGR